MALTLVQRSQNWFLKAMGRLPLPKTTENGRAWWNGSDFEFADWLAGSRAKITRSDAGKYRDNSAVMACVNTIVTSWVAAPLQVGRMTGSEFMAEASHPLPRLLERPAPRVTGQWLYGSWIRDFIAEGDAYAQIIEVGGNITELNYLPAGYIQPKPDGQGQLSHYEYRVNGRIIPVQPDEMLRFRCGINPDDLLRGLSCLDSGFRDIAIDNGSSNYGAGLMKGGGVPPFLLVPGDTKDGYGQPAMTQTEADTTSQILNEKLEQEPGKMRLIPINLKLLQLSFKPGEMGLETMRMMAESRIAALIGVPPIVAGLQIGLEKATYSNYEQAVRQAWDECISPLQDYFADEMTVQLLHRFKGTRGDLRAMFDRSRIPALQPDEAKVRESAREDFKVSILTLEEVRAEGGRTTTPAIAAQIEAEKPALPAPQLALPSGEEKALTLKRESLPSLEEAITAFRAEMARREAGAVRHMTSALDAASKEIEKRLAALEERMEAAIAEGTEISEAWLFREERLSQLLAGIREEYDNIATHTLEPLTAEQSKAIAAAVKHSERLARAAAGTPPADAVLPWTRLRVETLRALAGYTSDGSPLAMLLRELGPDAEQAARDALFSGVALGENPRQLAGRIAGQTGMARVRALTIARTEVHRVARAATKSSYQANADVVDGWVWTASLDDRCCSSCWALHGRRFLLSEDLDDHCNGRCKMVPATKSWAQILGDDTIPDTRPVIEPGTAQFDRLSAEEQQRILGPGAYEAWSEGKITLSDMVTQDTDDRWGTMRRESTLQEALARAGG